MKFDTNEKKQEERKPRYGHWWLTTGESVHLRCGGDDLPTEWWDGNERRQRDGGRWWNPTRAILLRQWAVEHEREIDRIITAPAERERMIRIRVEVAWARRVRQAASEQAIACTEDMTRLPDQLPDATVAWMAEQRAIADELADLALAMHPRLAGDKPAWITLRNAVVRNEQWLIRAVELGVMSAPPMVGGCPILPVQHRVHDDDARMRAAEQLARDMVDPKAQLVPVAEAEVESER